MKEDEAATKQRLQDTKEFWRTLSSNSLQSAVQHPGPMKQTNTKSAPLKGKKSGGKAADLPSGFKKKSAKVKVKNESDKEDDDSDGSKVKFAVTSTKGSAVQTTSAPAVEDSSDTTSSLTSSSSSTTPITLSE